MTKKYRGFTLIELLVVIAIIGILASIVLVSLTTARTRAYDAEIKSELSQLRAAEEMDYIDNDKYTTGVSEVEGKTVYDALKALKSPGCSADDNYQLATDDAKAQKYAAWCDLCTGADDDPGHDWCVDSTGYSGPATMDAGNMYVCH